MSRPPPLLHWLDYGLIGPVACRRKFPVRIPLVGPLQLDALLVCAVISGLVGVTLFVGRTFWFLRKFSTDSIVSGEALAGMIHEDRDDGFLKLLYRDRLEARRTVTGWEARRTVTGWKPVVQAARLVYFDTSKLDSAVGNWTGFEIPSCSAKGLLN